MAVTCVCGKGASTTACCAPYHRGDKQPDTAEALMRARYAAYAVGDIEFITRTQDPATLEDVEGESAQRWSRDSEWLGLEIVSTKGGGPDDNEGEVEFIARYKSGGGAYTHHELSRFRRIDTRWFYVEGDMVTPQTVRRATPKVGRNDPCPCGSGKKYKKCCAA